MEYNGYVAEVEYDEVAAVFYGRVVNAGPYPIATFEAGDAAELMPEFQWSVEEYLAACREEGVEPRKPLTPATQAGGQGSGGSG